MNFAFEVGNLEDFAELFKRFWELFWIYVIADAYHPRIRLANQTAIEDFPWTHQAYLKPFEEL